MNENLILQAAIARLRDDPNFASDLSPEERQKLLDDPDLLSDTIFSDASNVITVGWDGGTPGASGCSSLSEWRGIYFITSSDFDTIGPFSSLDDALANELFHWPTPEPSLGSSIVPLERLLDIGVGLIDRENSEDTIEINDRLYRLVQGKLQESESSY